MNYQSPASVMEQFWGYLAKSVDGSGAADWDGALALMHPDVRIVEPDSLPYGGVTYGPAAYRQLVAEITDLWSPEGKLSRSFFISGDSIVYRTGASARAKKTGRLFQVETMTQWTVRNGLITEVYHFYFDVCAVREALGFTPCPEPESKL